MDGQVSGSVEVDGLTYALDRPPSRGGRKSVVTVRLAAEPRGGALVDRVDLFAFRSRRAFSQIVADHFARRVDEIMGHVALVLDEAERAAGASERTSPVGVTGERKQVAEELLRRPDLLDRAAGTLDGLGLVGEDSVRRIAYLACVSRLLERPLSVLLVSVSASGKSSVLDAIVRLMPEESVHVSSKLSPAALYYLGPGALEHKILVVDEYDGLSDADLPLRLLQSRGELRLNVMVKGKTEQFVARGPCAVLSGTTSSKIDVQNSSRTIVLSLDDSAAQTQKVMAAQRRAWTGSSAHGVDLVPWQDAQRLLERRPVVIPYAERLQHPCRSTTDRRSNQQLLTLIASCTLLHQRRRDLDPLGRLVATVDDYRTVFELLQPALERALDGLSPRATRLFSEVERRSAATFTRRQIATSLGWSYNTARRALDELLAEELVAVADRGPPASYRVLDRSVLGTAGGLVAPDDLAPGKKRVASRRPPVANRRNRHRK